MRITTCVLAAVFVGLFAASASAQTCPPSPDWSYQAPKDPSHWAEQWPACGGKAQSPIDIAIGPATKGAAIEFHYQPFDLEVSNTSHVIEVEVPKGSYITLGGHRYDLVQFHFHTPTEHRFGGKQGVLELHLVHRDADGKLAVVGALAFDSGANKALDSVIAPLPVAACGKKEAHTKFDASSLLPKGRDYVTYAGSLTTPGCTEGVTWLVLTDPITASAAQVKALDPFGIDARPVQPLNGRKVTRVGAK
jgi:carbonic anhydrase